MRRAAIALIAVVLVAGCSGENVEQTLVPVDNPRSSASQVPVLTPTPGYLITGIGATVDAWNGAHTADLRFAPGSAFDPTPGLGSDHLHDSKYYAVTTDGEYVITYKMRIPNGSTRAEARAAALTQLPDDAKVLWSTTRATCGQMEVQSATLRDALPDAVSKSGMVFVEFSTVLASGAEVYRATNVNELFVALLEFPKKADAIGC